MVGNALLLSRHYAGLLDALLAPAARTIDEDAGKPQEACRAKKAAQDSSSWIVAREGDDDSRANSGEANDGSDNDTCPCATTIADNCVPLQGLAMCLLSLGH